MLLRIVMLSTPPSPPTTIPLCAAPVIVLLTMIERLFWS
jgi:hypothetical protein